MAPVPDAPSKGPTHAMPPGPPPPLPPEEAPPRPSASAGLVTVDLAPDADRVALEGALTAPAGQEAGDARVRRLGRIKSPLGMFVASKILGKPSRRESEILLHRSRAAFVDGAAMTVPILFNEIGSKNPNKVRIDACLAVQRGAGIMVDSVPVSAEQRKKQIDHDRKLAERSTEEIKAGLVDRLSAMRRQSDATEK